MAKKANKKMMWIIVGVVVVLALIGAGIYLTSDKCPSCKKGTKGSCMTARACPSDCPDCAGCECASNDGNSVCDELTGLCKPCNEETAPCETTNADWKCEDGSCRKQCWDWEAKIAVDCNGDPRDPNSNYVKNRCWDPRSGYCRKNGVPNGKICQPGNWFACVDPDSYQD